MSAKLPNYLAKLPKWFGERPGKKPGDPESPDDEDEGPAEVPPGTRHIIHFTFLCTVHLLFI